MRVAHVPGKAHLTKFALDAGSFAISFFALAGTGLAQNKPLKKIHVGVPSVGMGNIIIFVTKEAKLFEKYGLEGQAGPD